MQRTNIDYRFTMPPFLITVYEKNVALPGQILHVTLHCSEARSRASNVSLVHSCKSDCRLQVAHVEFSSLQLPRRRKLDIVVQIADIYWSHNHS